VVGGDEIHIVASERHGCGHLSACGNGRRLILIIRGA
jgi:hypothetical protein